MSKLYSVTLVLAIFSLHKIVKSEEYNEADAGEDDIGSKEVNQSDSNEIFNETSKEKPERLKGNVTKLKDAILTSLSDVNSYAVSIQKKGSHYSSGALVNRKWILTAAGDFYNVRESIKIFRARLGSVNCKKGGILVPLRKIEIHPLYVYKEPKFDLALLRIAQVLEFSDHIQPINLSKSKGQLVNAKFTVKYWPRIIVHGKTLPQTAQERLLQNTMRVSKQNLVPWKQCKTILQSYNYSIGATNLCLEPIQSYHSECMPDTGAPVVDNDGLWGITSGWTAKECPEQPMPTIATRTSLPLMRSWLDTLL